MIELYPEMASDHDDVAWRSMRGMRNRIAHDYVSIDLDVVWTTLQIALPELAKSLDGVT